MRYITIPDDAWIETAALDGSKERVSFQKLMLHLWTLDSSFSERGISGLEQALKIRTLFRGKEPRDIVPIEDEDWRALNEVVERPRPNSIPQPRLLEAIEHFRAVTTAVTTAPSEAPDAAKPTR
ncbi:MAG TPA: hypothetical protein VK989_04285 [Polyangia bacterium]|nr:hypothetical protein [Polyangia bacterium]